MPSVSALPGARLCNHVGWTSQNRSRNSTQDFVEGDVHGIKQSRNLGILASVKWLAFPEPGSIQMRRYIALPRPVYELVQRFPATELSTKVPLRQFHEQIPYRVRDCF